MAIIYGRPDSEIQLLSKYPRAVKTIDDIPKIHHEVKEKLKNNSGRFFGEIRRWYHQRQANLFELNKGNLLHAGASGELHALDRLCRLGDEYHVLCGVNIELNDWVTYNGKRNLRSAQMDFVVVSKKGVAVIEVKNWSGRSPYRRNGMSPHEQVERAGRVLWIALQSWWSPKHPRVTSVILSIQGNIGYDPRHKYVRVANLNTIDSLLENRKVEFSEKEVRRIVGRLKHHVTQ
jgi:hypothetical protein